MTNEKFYEMRENREKELQEELLRVQCDGEDKGYIYAGRLDFNYSEFWFQIETFTAAGRIYPHYFACKTLADLKEGIRWILEDTAFSGMGGSCFFCMYGSRSSVGSAVSAAIPAFSSLLSDIFQIPS